MTRPRIPAAAAFVVERLLPAGLGAPIAGDLIEEHALRLRTEGARAADRWICGQLLRSVPVLAWASARRDSWHLTLAVAATAWFLFGKLDMWVTSAVLAVIPSTGVAPVAASLSIGLVLAALIACVATLIRPAAALVFSVFTVAALAVLTLTGAGGTDAWRHLVFLASCPFAISLGREFGQRPRRGI
jgi:hypothetical protein